jgi:hypothetical protein
MVWASGKSTLSRSRNHVVIKSTLVIKSYHFRRKLLRVMLGMLDLGYCEPLRWMYLMLQAASAITPCHVKVLMVARAPCHPHKNSPRLELSLLLLYVLKIENWASNQAFILATSTLYAIRLLHFN